jgi:hypothetical protein
MLLALPHLRTGTQKVPLGDRLRDAVLKPADEGVPNNGAGAKAKDKARAAEELEFESKYANDRERIVGLLVAPLAGAIGLVVVSDLISYDKTHKVHYSQGLYESLAGVLVGLALVMLVTAWFRKRTYLAIAMALYGLAIFNLRYWGFGVPYVMMAAWLLVRSFRLQRDLREATGGSGPERGAQARRGSATVRNPRASKRYTPRATTARRQSAPRAPKT